MTVVNLSSDSIIKKVVWGKTRTKNQKILWLGVNLFLVFSLIVGGGILIFHNIWHLNTRLEIQNLEKKLIILEEKNAELKNRWQELKNFYNFQKIIEENKLVLVEQPNYLTFEKTSIPLGMNLSHEKSY